MIEEILIDKWAGQHYPGLRRGMTISVERDRCGILPGSIASYLLARGIVYFTKVITGKCAKVEHKMLYMGDGWCWSQSMKFGVVHLANYRGCILRFRDNPAWTPAERNQLMGDAGPFHGKEYDIPDLFRFMALALRRPDTLPWDHVHWVCSEAVHAIVGMTQPGYGGAYPDRPPTPQELDDWEDEQGWSCLTRRIL